MALAGARRREFGEPHQRLLRFAQAEIQAREGPIRERRLVAEAAGCRQRERVARVSAALVLAALNGCDQREGGVQVADRVLLAGLVGQAKSLAGVGGGSRVPPAHCLGAGQELENVRHHRHRARLTGARDRATVELVLGRLVAEIAGARAGVHQAAGILKAGGQGERLPQERRPTRRVPGEQAAYTDDDVDREALVEIVLVEQRRRTPAELDDLRGVAGIRGGLGRLDEHLDRLGGSDRRHLGRAGGQDGRGVGGDPAAQPDRPAQVRNVGADPKIADEAVGAIE